MPRIWLDYCQFLMDQGRITRTRRTFDRALRALPVTQHDRIWQLYLKFVKMHYIPESTVRVYRRYLKVDTFKLFIIFFILVFAIDFIVVAHASLRASLTKQTLNFLND